MFDTNRLLRAGTTRWLLSFYALLPLLTWAQTPLPQDSVQPLEAVVVRAYLSQQPYLKTPASVGLIGPEQWRQRTELSPVAAFNDLPGIRMEERSPGSYRLSIRGSLLRSPFGVRNVKVYLDEFPLTDAGGNTYINLLDFGGISSAEVLKGPDGSLFGANSGGVVLLNLHEFPSEGRRIHGSLQGGSFGLFRQQAGFQQQVDRSTLKLHQSFQRSDGYRDQSALRRHYLQGSQQWELGKGHQLKWLGFFSDLRYETPGGLTLAQFEEDPTQARQPAGPNPGAETQQAGIFNTTGFGGLRHEFQPNHRFRLVTALFGSVTQLENPFITNYEIREEENLGVRAFAEWDSRDEGWIRWKWSSGLEGMKGWQEVANYENDAGEQGFLLAADDLKIDQVFYFTRFRAIIGKRLTAEAAVSLNRFRYAYRNEEGGGSRRFQNQWMPRVALSYAVTPDLALRASVSRGYSPPTLAEVRSSNTEINTALEPESGWNREVGFRLSAGRGRLQIDASVYRYDLEEAIVRRLDAGGNEFFTNAGGTRQTGFEYLVQAWLLPKRDFGFLRGVQLSQSLTWNWFTFSTYQVDDNDFSGNALTGVPESVVVTGLQWYFAKGIHLNATWNATSKIPLNDDNSVYADSYDLLQLRISVPLRVGKNLRTEVFAGGDNLLNESYSLGNDSNAFGGRYFNPAPEINFYGGIVFTLF